MLGNLLLILQRFWKQVRYLLIAQILTVEVPFCSWVHHLETFSSGVTMLFIFNAMLPPRFLALHFQNRVTCSNKPSSHTVSSCACECYSVDRSISCPKTLKNEQMLLYASEMYYSNTIFAAWFRKKFSDWNEELYPSCSRELKRQKRLPYEWAYQSFQHHLLSLVDGSSSMAQEASIHHVAK